MDEASNMFRDFELQFDHLKRRKLEKRAILFLGLLTEISTNSSFTGVFRYFDPRATASGLDSRIVLSCLDF
jgi:hypothetical protein